MNVEYHIVVSDPETCLDLLHTFLQLNFCNYLFGLLTLAALIYVEAFGKQGKVRYALQCLLMFKIIIMFM